MALEEQSIYRQRRKRLMEKMGSRSIGIWMSPPARTRNHDVEYPFRQTSDLLYLSGCPEPEAVLVIAPEQPEGQRSILFVRPRDPEREIWNGRRLGPEGALGYYGVDITHPITAMETELPRLLIGIERVYIRTGLEPDQDRRNLAWFEGMKRQRRFGKITPSQIIDASVLTAEMRLFKDEAEIAWMRKAAAINCAAHQAAMAAAKPGMYEYELAALLHYHYERSGSTGAAYQTIVGTGENATILHYTENKDPLQDGDLVLIDAGCEWNHYASDITRTFPANGRFTSQQRDVYQIVLDALDAGINACFAGKTLTDIHDAAVRKITQGLIDLKILQGSLDALIEEGAYKTFYMHRSSHWLGLDVHDAGGDCDLQGNPRILAPGMILTIEPGLYFHAYHDVESAKPFQGIGIRIEDNLLITPHGHENLTVQTPRTIEEIEAACQS